MAERSEIRTEDFARAFKRFMDQANAQAPADEPVFAARLRSHFGDDPSAMPVVGQGFGSRQHPNVQVAIDAYLDQPGRSAEILGIGADSFQTEFGVSLSQLLTSSGGGRSPLVEGPVEHLNVRLADDEVLTCVKRGLYLVQDREARLAVLVSGARHEQLRVEVMAPRREQAEDFLAQLRAAMRERSVYRGRVLSLVGGIGDIAIEFHKLPQIGRDKIVLPEGLLDRVERHTLGFARHAEELLEAGRHLKRGLLLHGPPGTGKTLTAMYLASLMRDRTVMLLKGRGFGLIEQSCKMARTLAPSMVILEDVDLVAEERTRGGAAGCTPLLFELLNEMDGLADDVDIVFVLTTNRPDLLEPALAARPGRVDQAIEIPLPDEECRRRLFALYAEGLELEVDDFESLVHRTEGASGAFIRELLRKAAVISAEAGDGVVVRDEHLDEAIHELVDQGGDLTKSLLGARTTVGF